MTGWPATVAPKWAIARNHAATVEEDVIREAPVVPTGGQAGRWQAITDTTTIEFSLVDLKEKGATPQDRRFLCVDCIKRTTAALGCRGRNNRSRPQPAEPPRNVLRGKVERATSVGLRAGIAVGNPDVVRLPTSSRSTGRRQVGSHERFSETGSRAHAQTGDGRLTRWFLVGSRFPFLKQQQYIVLVTYGGICGVLCWQWNGQSFPRTLANKITDAGEICSASREAHKIKRMRGCILLTLLSLYAPGMSSNHRRRRPRRKASVRGCKAFLFRQQQQCQPRRERFRTCPIDG